MILIAIIYRMNIRYSIISAFVKTVFSTLSGQEAQQLLPTTRQVYESWVKEKAAANKAPNHKDRLVRDIQLLDTGRDSAIMWIGNRQRAKKVVLFLHGGGYTLSINSGHIQWCWNAYVLAGNEAGVETAVAILQYTLAPRGTIPVPLQQAVAAFNEIRAQGFEPADIIIGGDSAGGNLTMQLLGHMLHPHSAVPEIKLSQPLAGAFLVSPWLGSNTNSKSFSTNARCDMITAGIVKILTVQSLEDSDLAAFESVENPWVRPIECDPVFFTGLNNIVNRVFITVGDAEVLADHGIAMAQILKQYVPELTVRLDRIPGAPHDAILLEAMSGKVGDVTRQMKGWFKPVIRGK
jgi:acetyl esterase/lipase